MNTPSGRGRTCRKPAQNRPNRGAEVISEAHAEVISEWGAEVISESGAEVISEPGAELISESGAEVPRNPQADENAGAKSPVRSGREACR
jgi:trimethylamine:corrinoid methyltransferase-like protein